MKRSRMLIRNCVNMELTNIGVAYENGMKYMDRLLTSQSKPRCTGIAV